MKRLALISVLVFYTLASFGVSVNYFYCCGQLKEVSFSAHPIAESCKKNSSAEEQKCCDNQSVTLQMHADQKNVEYKSSTVNRTVVTLPVVYDVLPSPALTQMALSTLLYSNPPLLALTAKQILFCSYLI